MNNLNNLFNEGAPQNLVDFVSGCASGEELIKKIEQEPSRLISIIQNMDVEGNEPLAARLLYKVSPNDLNPEVKKVETTLRNLGMLNRACDPDISLREEYSAPVSAHKLILALESPYFEGMKGFSEFQKGEIVMMDTGISPEAYQRVVEYLYLSDEKRKEFVSTLDKTLLPQIVQLSFHWQVNELKERCDDELCNSLGELNIEKRDVSDWSEQSHLIPKFAKLLAFVNRVAGEDDLDSVITKMDTPEGAAQIASKCTPEEMEVFATLKTEFGKACRIPPGAFGKVEWEKTFPVTIEEVPPLPPNIHAILEQEDPCEPGKKLKDTCMLFLRPEKVILHQESGDKEVTLGFDGVEELAKNATNVERQTQYDTFNTLRGRMNAMPVEGPSWVLMRKEVIPGSRNKSFTDQQELFKGSFEVPKMMDAILLNIITYTSEGRCLYGQEPWTFTRCQEKFDDYQTVVGGFAPSGLSVIYFNLDHEISGLSGSWKF